MVGAVIALVLVGLLIVSISHQNRLRKLEAATKVLDGQQISLAKTVGTVLPAAQEAQSDAKEALKVALDNQAQIADIEKRLTSATEKPKLVPKPAKVNFRQFATAAERASEIQEEA